MAVSDQLKSLIRERWANTPPSDWTYHRIGDVLKKKARRIDVEDSVLYTQPVIRRGHGGIEIRERQYGREILTKRQFRLKKNDWLMSKVQILHQSYGIVPEELDGAIASGSYYAFQPSEEDLDLQYLWYLSHHPAFHESCALASVGVVIEKMVFRVKDWLDFPILLPPLPEQQKIAAILSSVDDVIAATRKVIEQTKRVKAGLLQTLMTRGIGHTRFKKTEIGEIPEEWQVVRVDALGDVVTGATPSTKDPELWDGETPFITPGDLGEDTVMVESGERTLSETGVSAGRSVPAGSVLMTCIASIGKAGIAGRTVAFNQQINAIQPLEGVVPRYLLAAMRYHTPRLMSLAGTQTVPIINKSKFSSFRIPLPPEPEQRRIAQVLASIDRTTETNLREVGRLSTLKRGLMQDLLTGHVRVQPD